MSTAVSTTTDVAPVAVSRQAFGAFRAQRTFGSLDGLRAVSILAVILFHSALGGPDSLAKKGYLGVDLFFAISGFLITTLLLRERTSRGRISLRNFYIRRSLRIFPLYYTMVAVYCCLVAVMERSTPRGQEFWHNLPFYLTYTSNWFIDVQGGHVIFYIAWSLATEEQFYLVWPSLERWLKGWWPVAVMAGLLAAVLAAKGGLLDAALAPGLLPWIVLRSVAVPICLGVLLAHLLHEPRGFRLFHGILGWRGGSAAVAAGLLLLVACAPLTHKAASLGWLLAVHAGMALLVGACVIREDHVLAGVLGCRPMRTIGTISYGLYLMHVLALVGTGMVLRHMGLTSEILRVLLATSLAVGAAWCSYHYYESIFLRMKDRFRSI